MSGSQNGEGARDLLPEYALGLLPEAARAEVKAEVAGSPALADELHQVELALTALSASLPAASSTADGRRRLLATLGSPDRFRDFLPLLQRWFDLDGGALSKVLGDADGTAVWLAGPAPGVQYFHFQGGPAAERLESGCVRLRPGARFPRHVHQGHEKAMVLEGTLLLGGRAFHAGDVVEAAAGSAHEFVAGGGRDLLLIVGHDGIRFTD